VQQSMTRTLLLVGDWRGAARLAASAIATDWRVIQTPTFDEVPDTMDQLRSHVVVLGGDAAALTPSDSDSLVEISRRAPVVTLSDGNAQDLLTLLVVAPAADHPHAPAPRRPLGLKRERSVTPSIDAALEFIEANHAEPISLADAARAATYSRCHFCKLFKEQVGVGFVSYLTDVRLRHARRLLSDSKMNVTDVALAVGFGDLCHFERVFRRRHRQTPSQYRAGAHGQRNFARHTAIARA
jgi:AraC-like DNA-binding protein